jgi:hypothetical protein
MEINKIKSLKMHNFNFDPMNIDLITRPGEAFLKCMGFLTLGTVMEVNINDIHLPPIFIEVARFLAYMGASVAFFKFIINLFRGKKEIKEDKNPEEKE